MLKVLQLVWWVYKSLRCYLNSHDITVMIEPLKVWHDVINLEFIIYLMMLQFHFYLSLFHILYFMSILVCIFCILRDLGALGVASKI